MMKISSMGKVCPKFQMDVVDLKISLMHQIMLYYEYVKYFLRSERVMIIFISLNNIFRIIMWEVMNVQMYQMIE